jgi:hypothetical protein
VNERELDALLEAATRADAARETPRRVEADLLAAYRATHAAPASAGGSGRRALGQWIWAGLAAAAVVVAISATLGRGVPATTEIVRSEDEEAEFLPLSWDSAGIDDLEAVQVVTVQIPRTALAGLGYAGPLLAGEGDALRAELLVGNDGMARGIRFVQ